MSSWSSIQIMIAVSSALITFTLMYQFYTRNPTLFQGTKRGSCKNCGKQQQQQQDLGRDDQRINKPMKERDPTDLLSTGNWEAQRDMELSLTGSNISGIQTPATYESWDDRQFTAKFAGLVPGTTE